jgi:hypothetical protein
MGDEDNKFLRITPQSDLDFQLMVTNPVWGTEAGVNEFANKDLKDALRMLTYLNRDLRLSNLSPEELYYVRWYLEFAGDLITENLNQNSYNNSNYIMLEPFIICIKNVASVTETSQGKKGFLRKLFNTLTSVNVQSSDEPPKKSLFTGKNKGGD